MRHRCRILALTLIALAFVSGLRGETDTVLILHTNDIHDHLRPDYDGVGGLPFVSGYIKRVRALRDDVLVLDAGDVAEKGDMVAFETQSELVYEAMGGIGYHAGAPGNHEHDFGIPKLRKYESLAAGMKMLCINLIKDDGTPEFPPSAVFDIGGVKVGVIGLIVPRDTNCLNGEESAVAMAREAEHLDEEADLVVAVCHLGVFHCRMISRVAPAIDVFVSGHSHEALREAVVVEETGALIVQAGSYAEYVGRLELTIDLETEEVVWHESGLVPMRHDTVPCDVEMLEWIRVQEQAISPEATRIVAWTDTVISRVEVGHLAAAALRTRSRADIGFCHAGQVIRDDLPKGVLDVNAVFRTGGQRGYRIVEATLTGSEIEFYLNGLQRSDWDQTQWSGFKASLISNPEGAEVLHTDLEPDHSYRVVMPEMEWRTRLMRLFRKVRENPQEWQLEAPERQITPTDLPFTFTDAVTEYLEGLMRDGIALHTYIKRLAAAAQLSGE